MIQQELENQGVKRVSPGHDLRLALAKSFTVAATSRIDMYLDNQEIL